MNPNLVRDALEGLMVLAVAGIIWSSVARLRAGKIRAFMCNSCNRPTSRAYARCPRCGASLSPSQETSEQPGARG